MPHYLPINPFSRPGERIEYFWGVVWHWVGKAGQGKSGVERYFELLADQDETDDSARYASSHYIVDASGVKKVIPINEVAYHAGTSWWNKHTVGIEVCHPDWTGEFEEKTLWYLYDLTAFLLKVHSLGTERIRRHFDITGKLCPRWFVDYPEEYKKAKREVAKLL